MHIKSLLLLGFVASTILSASFAHAHGKEGKYKHKRYAESQYLNIDTNGDGNISLEEYQAQYTPERIEDRFKQKDLNKDGNLTKQEMYYSGRKKDFRKDYK